MITVRGHALASVLHALEAVDLKNEKCLHTSCNYRLYGNQLIRTPSARALLRAIPRPGRNVREKTVVNLPIRADRILIKNNIRVFGLPGAHEKTAKVALPGAMRKGNLLREIRARRLLREINSGVRVPRLDTYDSRSGRWLVERQIIEKKNVPRKRMAQEFLTQYAPKFYGTTARLRSTTRHLPAGMYERLSLVLPRTISSLNLRPLQWPVAFCHGDLSAGNMLWSRSEKSLYLVDWENAGVAPVACELRKVFIKYPGLREVILRLIDDLAVAPGTAPANLQMALALAHEVATARMQERKRLAYLASGRNARLEEARASFERTLVYQEKLINELLA